jgi:hypothetical protein
MEVWVKMELSGAIRLGEKVCCLPRLLRHHRHLIPYFEKLLLSGPEPFGLGQFTILLSLKSLYPQVLRLSVKEQSILRLVRK